MTDLLTLPRTPNFRVTAPGPEPRPLPLGYHHKWMPGIPRSCLALHGQAPPTAAPTLGPLRPLYETLLPWQQDGARFLLGSGRAYLYHRTGSGKTWTMGYTAAAWAQQKRDAHILFIVPPSAAYWQFISEIGVLYSKMDGEAPPLIPLESTTPDPALLQGPGMRFISWSCIKGWYDELLRWGVDGLLVDEAHFGMAHRRVYQKDANGVWGLSGNAGALKGLSYVTRKLVLATATPTSTGRIDTWNQYDALEPGCWGSAKEFGFHFCEGVEGAYSWEANGRSHDEEYIPRARYLTHIVRTQDLDGRLPNLTFAPVFLDKEQLNKPLTRGKLRDNKPGTKTHAAQIDAAERKTEWAVSFVKESLARGLTKLALVTGRRAHLSALKKALGKAFPQVPVFVYAGASTGPTLRVPAQYQAAKLGIFLTTYQKGGVSLNLHSTQRAALLLCPWTPKELLQLAGRFQRIGGVDCELVVPFARGTADDILRQAVLPRLADLFEFGEDATVQDMRDGLDTSTVDEEAMIAELLDLTADWS